MPSTVIRSFHHNPAENFLTITFVSGSTYRYKDFPEALYMEMKQFREKGVFYNRYIKGKFEYEKISNI